MFGKKPYDYKIYVAGPFQAGKTTLIHKLDPKALSIEKPLRDGSGSTTTAFDLGHVFWVRPREESQGLVISEQEFEKEKDQYNGYIVSKVELKGGPGQIHFKAVREMVMKNSDGILFLVDSSDPMSIGQASALLEEAVLHLGKDIPIVVLANKQDLPDAMPVETVKTLLGDSEIITDIFPASALNNVGISDAISYLLMKIKKRKESLSGGN